MRPMSPSAAHPPFAAQGHIGTKTFGADIQANWDGDSLSILTSLRGLVIAPLSSPERSLSLQVREASTAPLHLSIVPQHPQKQGWAAAALNWFTGLRHDSYAVIELLEHHLQGQVNDQRVTVQWQEQRLELVRSPVALDRREGAQLNGTLYRTGLKHPEVPVNLTIDQTGQESRLSGRIGAPHPQDGKDVTISGTMPPTLLGLVVCLSYLLLTQEMEANG